MEPHFFHRSTPGDVHGTSINIGSGEKHSVKAPFVFLNSFVLNMVLSIVVVEFISDNKKTLYGACFVVTGLT